MISYDPDWDDTLESAAEFLCARLAGRQARFAGDPTLQDRTRKFGLLYANSNDPRGEGVGWFLDHVRDRCGDVAGEIVIEQFESPPYESGTVARLRTAGVTTVVLLPSEVNIAIHADAAKWYPEWYLAEGLFTSRNMSTRLFWPPLQARSAFGITAQRRFGAPADQPHRVALQEECADCRGPRIGLLVEVYHDLLLLYWGIQAAGPRLTPANFDKGLHAIPPRRSLDPFTPAAYFAPGNYSFVKDYTAVWWDPAGPPPGTHAVGCWRLVEDGLRYRAQDWAKRQGDGDIRGQGQPCQGDFEGL